MLKALRQYLVGSREEFKKVTWPTRERFIRSFVIVVITVVISVAVVTIIDSLLQMVLKAILT